MDGSIHASGSYPVVQCQEAGYQELSMGPSWKSCKVACIRHFGHLAKNAIARLQYLDPQATFNRRGFAPNQLIARCNKTCFRISRVQVSFSTFHPFEGRVLQLSTFGQVPSFSAGWSSKLGLFIGNPGQLHVAKRNNLAQLELADISNSKKAMGSLPT